MPWLNGVLIAYALILFAGGIYGFYAPAAPSYASLFTSGAAAVLVLLGVYVAQKRMRLGYGIAAAVIGLVILFFVIRIAGGKTMPAVPVVALSLIVTFCLSVGHAQRKRLDMGIPKE
jgi:hypothetical protein